MATVRALTQNDFETARRESVSICDEISQELESLPSKLAFSVLGLTDPNASPLDGVHDRLIGL